MKHLISNILILMTALTAEAFNNRDALQENLEIPRWELKTAPVALWAGWYTLDVSYRISKNWTTGPAVVEYRGSEGGNMFAPSYRGYAVGWNANYYLKSVMENGWYLSSHSYYEKYSSFPHGYRGHEELNGYRVNLVAGYHWLARDVNLMAGFGSEYRSHNVIDKTRAAVEDETQVRTFHENRSLPHIEFKIGIQI
jgi:hypothetical protein